MKENVSEQSSPKSEAEAMPLDQFSSLSIEEMETKLKAPVKADDQSEKNSETSKEVSESEEITPKLEEDEGSDTQTEEETSEEIVNEEQSESASVKDKQKLDYEKSYKELLPEYTRSRQELKALNDRLAALENKSVAPTEVAPKTDNKKLAQLKEKSPETAEFIEGLVDELVAEKIKPVEEQVAVGKKQANLDAFNKGVESFKTSDLAPLEAELVAIINEDPKWQERILSDANTFKELEKELVYRHRDKIVKLSKTSAKKVATSRKQEMIENADVGKKPNKSGGEKPTDEMSDDEFKNLSLAEMEKRLPKHKN